MEIKQIVMLVFLLLVAFVGTGVLVHTMMNLDKKDDDNNHDNGHGH